MHKIIENFFTCTMSGVSFVMIPEEYKGSPPLGYEPDIIICSRRIFNKYSNTTFIYQKTGKTKVLLTDEENIIFI